MRDRGAGSVLVTDKDLVTGILTERDYLTKVTASAHVRDSSSTMCFQLDILPSQIVVRGRGSQTTSISDVMSSEIISVGMSVRTVACFCNNFDNIHSQLIGCSGLYVYLSATLFRYRRVIGPLPFNTDQ
jgi:hypothetical protein